MAPFPAPVVPDAPLLVGYSGGLDSTVLLHWLCGNARAAGVPLRAVHVHHGLQAAADDWVAHCQRQCRAWGVPLAVHRAHVDAESGLGPEGAARQARQRAFRAELQEGERLVLAQHQDDQAETLLLRALRGSGVDGLAAMADHALLDGHPLWRPLLQVPRAALRAYARRHELAWIEDPSNADPAADRNFLRLQVLPLLRQRWPHASSALAASAGHCGQLRTLLDDEDQALLEHVQVGARVICVERLRPLSVARRARVLRRWVLHAGAPPLPASVLAQLEHELLPAAPDRQAQVRWQSSSIRQWRAHWYLLPATLPRLPAQWHAEWSGQRPLALPDGGELRLLGAAAWDAALQVRPRRGGERIQLPGRTHRHALKDCLQREHLAPWRRAQVPLLYAGGELQGAADVVASEWLQAWLARHGARLQWRPGGW